MKLSFAELENIVKTLPIGLYSNYRIEMVLSKDAKTSYFVPSTNTIFLSLGIINEGLKTIDENQEESYKETAIRSMLYHEVSHAILTPRDLDMRTEVNIFEDERIETILNNYFLDTNFKRQVYLISGYDGSAPKTPEEAFFNLVRLRVHKRKDFLDKVQEIIDRYKDLTDRWKSYQYANDVRRFYREVEEDFRKNGGSSLQDAIDSGAIEGSLSDGQNSGNGKIDTGETYEAMKDLVNKALQNALNQVGDTEEAKRVKGEGQKSSSNGNGMKGEDVSDNNSEEESSNGENDETLKSAKGAGRGNSAHKIIQKSLERNVDDDLYKALELILINFNKRNNSGSALSAYSGTLNPRMAGRSDFRIFEKPTAVNGSNKYGTLHLNLFIDRSGSFQDNQEKANTLINCLARLENRYGKIFSFDLITCGDGETLITDKRNRYLYCDDGTCMDREMEKIYKQVQRQNTYNYNIVLYDGFCEMNGIANGFKTFDNRNSLIISDESNDTYFKDIHSAKVIIVKNRSFADSLFGNIINTLKIAFR